MSDVQTCTCPGEGERPWCPIHSPEPKHLGWAFGFDSSALMALRGLLETYQPKYEVGHHTLVDALREYREMRRERDALLIAVRLLQHQEAPA